MKGQLWGEDWLLPQGLVGESVGGWSPPTRLPCSCPQFKRRVQESTQVLRELEISLRTNHIG